MPSIAVTFSSVDSPDILRLGTFLPLGDLELYRLPFIQVAVTGSLDGAIVYEHIPLTIGAGYKPISFFPTEPFDSSSH